MSKKIDSPVKRFPGSVTLSDPLTFPQSIQFGNAVRESIDMSTENSEEYYEYVKVIVPAIKVCVESWDIEEGGDLTHETFPSTPRESAPELLAWIISEVSALFRESEPEKDQKK